MRYRSHFLLSVRAVGSRNSRCLVGTSLRNLQLSFVSMHNESNVHYEVDEKNRLGFNVLSQQKVG